MEENQDASTSSPESPSEGATPPEAKPKRKRSKKAAAPVETLETAAAQEESPQENSEPVAEAEVEAESEESSAPQRVVGTSQYTLEQLSSMIESILMVSDRPVGLERLREVIGEEVTREQDIKDALDSIKERYESPRHGFELREGHGGFHFCTKAANAEIIRKFLQTKPFRLGRSALEVLSIIAYRQPITRAEIDKVRGIDSSHLMRTLMERGLVRMDGKADVPGRPVQYGTTPRFLEVTGLRSLGELPPLSELEQLQGHTPVDDHQKRMEEGLDRFVLGAKTRAEVDATGENIEGLDTIEEMINSVQKPDREIYESELHADVARENEAALEGFLNHMRPYRKPRKVVEEEVIVPEASASETPAIEIVPEIASDSVSSETQEPTLDN